ncbi:MAG: hypothetical protein IJ887_10535 [Prevotella sp.]|nr:hypothetical protein [Prevotella sp.]MBR3414313.1 hypothetical protein [Bacteroidales bacterium]MBR3479463.1 hypothetical protein [Prevotella sp.]
MKKLFFLLLVMTASFSASAQENEPKEIKLTNDERQLVENNNAFALRLFQKARGDESLLLSPLSITVDLGMLNNGADGITREEIDAVLGSKDVGGANVINQFCRKLLDESGTLDEKTRVAIANNIYVNTAAGYELLPAFVETAQNYYDATPESRDFGDGKTREVINKWGSDHTEGMIEEAIKEDEFNPQAVSYLLNALYFKGEWTHKFNAKETRRHVFDEGRKEVQMMHQESDFSYAENKVYQSVILPYGNMAYQMTVFLPREGKTIDDVLNELETSKDATLGSVAHYNPCTVDLYLPSFETETDMHLEDIMKSLGMPNSFEGGYGFNEFCNGNVFIGMMKQVAKIKLDEEGTEAAAVTIIEMDKSMSGPSYATFIADRPFLYVISERSTDAIFFIGQYMGEELKNVRKDITLTDEEEELVESNNDFAFRLFQKARGDENSIMSPLSITYALGMMNNGAAGQTQQEINDVLGFGQAGADGINNFCRKLLTEAPTLDAETKAEIANTIYVNSGKGYELQQGFVDKANEFYDAQPEARNFYDGETWEVINQWANDHTHGMIPKVFEEEEAFNQEAISYLLNALYFKGAWTNKFDKDNTRDEAFNGGATVPMMHQEEQFVYSENDLYQAIRLPYGNEAYQMTVFLPREGKTIGEVLSQMNGKNWRDKYASSSLVDLKLPRLKTNSNINLVNIMKELGMPTAFTPAAEFPYFGNRDGICIGNMFQTAAIKLDEEGTEAAAVTVIEMVESAIPDRIVFHANRPFFYIISEQSTGAIFFMGQYVGESSVTDPTQDPCDINRDGVIDVADIGYIIDVMTGNASGSLTGNTDVNGDGVVDVADISAVITAMAEK